MTTTENTTRPSNNTITRRKMLQSVAVVSAASIVSATAALASTEPTHPWERARHLAKELSQTLDEIDGGRWLAEVQPWSRTKYPVFFGDIDAIAESNAQADEEIIALAAEHEKLEATAWPLNERILDARARLHAYCEARALFPYGQHREVCKPLFDQFGMNALHDQMDPLWERCGEIEKRILDIVPITKAGIAAKAKIVLSVLPKKYAEDIPDTDRDWDVLLLRSLISNLQAQAAA